MQLRLGRRRMKSRMSSICLVYGRGCGAGLKAKCGSAESVTTRNSSQAPWLIVDGFTMRILLTLSWRNPSRPRRRVEGANRPIPPESNETPAVFRSKYKLELLSVAWSIAMFFRNRVPGPGNRRTGRRLRLRTTGLARHTGTQNASSLGTGIYAGLGAAAGIGLAAGGCAYAAMWPGSQLFGRTLTARASRVSWR